MQLKVVCSEIENKLVAHLPRLFDLIRLCKIILTGQHVRGSVRDLDLVQFFFCRLYRLFA